jgi:hypothetical protein
MHYPLSGLTAVLQAFIDLNGFGDLVKNKTPIMGMPTSTGYGETPIKGTFAVAMHLYAIHSRYQLEV